MENHRLLMSNKKVLVIDSTRLNNKPHPNPEIVNPLIKVAAINTIIVFTTQRKRPSVNTVKGNVKITNMGLTV